MAPLAFVAALYPRLSVGPTTAAIVVLIPQMMHTTPIASATERVEEVLLGGLTGLLISFVLLPSSAFQHAREIAAQALEKMAQAIPELFEGFEHGLSEAEAHRIQDGIGQQLNLLSRLPREAERERPLRLAEDPLTGPLFRTLLRLRHDLVIMGRAAHSPLPACLQEPLHALLQNIGQESKAVLQAGAAALLSKQKAPPREPLDAALTQYTAEIEALRREGKLRELSHEDIERLFATGFALEQLRLNLLRSGPLHRRMGRPPRLGVCAVQHGSPVRGGASIAFSVIASEAIERIPYEFFRASHSVTDTFFYAFEPD